MTSGLTRVRYERLCELPDDSIALGLGITAPADDAVENAVEARRVFFNSVRRAVARAIDMERTAGARSLELAVEHALREAELAEDSVREEAVRAAAEAVGAHWELRLQGLQREHEEAGRAAAAEKHAEIAARVEEVTLRGSLICPPMPPK